MEDEMRKKILSIPYTQWKKQGFSKGPLNYMKKNAQENKPFTLNKHIRERLRQWENPTHQKLRSANKS